MIQSLMTRRVIFAAFVAAAAVAAAGALTAGDAESGSQPQRHQDAGPAAEFFGVLRGEGATASARDREVGRRVVRSLGLPNLDAESTRTARTFRDGTAVRVVGGGSDYCLFKDEGQSLTCAKLNDRAGSSLAPVLALGAGYDQPVESAQFAALVGDGATDFRLAVEGSETVTLVPRNSVIAAEVPGRPLRLDWRNADGSAGSLQFGG